MNERHRLTISLLKIVDVNFMLFAFALTTIMIVKAEHGVSLVEFLSMRIRIGNL